MTDTGPAGLEAPLPGERQPVDNEHYRTGVWTGRAVAWQLLAAIMSTVAEGAMRVTVWAQERSLGSRRRSTAS